MDDKRILIINGKTEDQIIEQIIGLVNDDDELGDILKSYEESPGLNELIENMSAFFTVQQKNAFMRRPGIKLVPAWGKNDETVFPHNVKGVDHKLKVQIK